MHACWSICRGCTSGLARTRRRGSRPKRRQGGEHCGLVCFLGQKMRRMRRAANCKTSCKATIDECYSVLPPVISQDCALCNDMYLMTSGLSVDCECCQPQ